MFPKAVVDVRKQKATIEKAFSINIPQSVCLQDSAARIYHPDTLGVVVNKEQVHWTVFKVMDGQIWHLDSEKVPAIFTFERYVNKIRYCRNAFALIDES